MNKKPQGSKLKKIRKKLGLTQDELARKLKVTQECISQYEGGIFTIRLDVADRLIRLCKKHGLTITLDYIYLGRLNHEKVVRKGSAKRKY